MKIGEDAAKRLAHLPGRFPPTTIAAVQNQGITGQPGDDMTDTSELKKSRADSITAPLRHVTFRAYLDRKPLVPRYFDAGRRRGLGDGRNNVVSR